MSRPCVYETAKQIGAVRFEGGINWEWVFFASEEHAETFVKWCDANGFEHRGVYEPRKEPRQGVIGDTLYGVRFR